MEEHGQLTINGGEGDMKNCMCHGPRLRSPKGCKSNMERYRKTPNGNYEPINFDINCAKPLGCGSLGYHFSKRFHYPWVYYSRDLGADDHRPNSSLWIQKLLYGWIRMEYDDSYITFKYPKKMFNILYYYMDLANIHLTLTLL